MRVQWVHPTWRDLVIGRLEDDSRARQRFLRRSGVHGLVLALSTAGGGAGERQLPLIGSDDDWDALTDRLYTLVPEFEPPELIAVLSALSEALDELGESAEAGEAQAAARAAVGRTAALWNSARTPIPLSELDAWVSLAGKLRPRPAPPDLSVTWVELLPARAPELDDRAGLERFADWLAVCELLWGYDPELRSVLGFSAQVQLMTEFMHRVDLRRLQQAPAPLAATTADPVLRALDSIASLRPELSLYAEHLGRLLRRHTTAAARATRPPETSYSPVGTFDVHRVLLDL